MSVTAPDPRRTRLLLLEDCEDDAALLAIELESAGLSVELRRVATEPEFRDALSAYAPDIVVSDCNLPGFSGLQALALARAFAPAIPFVFLAGDIDELTATPAQATTADGYLGKDRIRDLPGVIQRLLS